MSEIGGNQQPGRKRKRAAGGSADAKTPQTKATQTKPAKSPQAKPAKAPSGHAPQRRRNRNQESRRGKTRGDNPATLRRLREARLAARPAVVNYPEQLPVSARRDEIAAAIAANQVVIVSGETGSGKTTQLPKICLELGYGIDGIIGHTQPRRIAARTVGERIAQELNTEFGQAVGYQVRFSDDTSAATAIKLMTDGILLNEIQRDPLLRRYEVIIVDEAHERSLNIDFLLGYLIQLLPQRPDLKVIITSATIDSQRFAEHFGTRERPAPVIEVSGRTYPVEIRYRPLIADLEEPDTAAPIPDEDIDMFTGICQAADELMGEGPGDILVFLAGERDIRETEAALADHLGTRFHKAGAIRSSNHAPDAVEVLPLYSRLSAAEQHRVFAPHTHRRIVLATNVAETSLTVPGIRYVIDPGLARISRFSARTKVQRLPIEPISRASANQRSGRCGRVADGIAIRLYSERDFNSRDEFIEPEILRTSLASVILQMTSLGLGSVEDFPFIQAPDTRSVRDGVALLEELGALKAAPTSPAGAPQAQKPGTRKRSGHTLTAVGRTLAQLPIDPRLGRMLIEANRLGVAQEVLIIVAGLSIQDVRERPADNPQPADESHRRFANDQSDFLSLLQLWDYLQTQQQELSGSAFRRMCRAEYLHFLRWREWQDVATQLRQMARPLGFSVKPLRTKLGEPDSDKIHQALLAGLLSHIGTYDLRKRDFLGARGSRFVIFPGSGLAKATPAWVMAGELVETSRLFARTVARIDPDWVEPLAEHLVKRTHSDPFWSIRNGAAMVHEKVLLFGVPIVADRTVLYGKLNEAEARQMFIQSALVEGEWRSHHKFVKANEAVLAEIAALEARNRRRDLVDDEAIFAFYDSRIPATITSARHFDAWWKNERRKDPDLLTMRMEDVAPHAELDEDAFPDAWVQGDLDLPLTYQFNPGVDADGVTVHVPLEVLPRLEETGFDWLVPGLLEELVIATIRGLPKPVRVQLVPAPDTARQILQILPDWAHAITGEISFQQAFTKAARQVKDAEIPADAWAALKLPAHLKITFRVHGNRGQIMGEDSDLSALKKKLARHSGEAVRTAVQSALKRAEREVARENTRQPAGTGAEISADSAATTPGTVATEAAPTGFPTGSLTTWPANLATIPEKISSTTHAGLLVEGFPALIAQPSLKSPGHEVTLQVLTSATEASAAHHTGVLALLTHALALPAGRITSRWSPSQALTMAASPYRSTEQLAWELQFAAIGSLCTELKIRPSQIRTLAAFDGARASLRDRLEHETARLAHIVITIIGATRELDSAISESSSMALLGVLNEVRAWQAELIYSGFIASTPPDQLHHLPRYLKAAAMRLEKAAENPGRDATNSWQVKSLHDSWWAALKAAEGDATRLARLAPVRWMIEELRVSLFAQQLGTAHPVSEKRIKRALAA